MKHQKGKKLTLNKLTVSHLDNEIQKKAFGGTDPLTFSACYPTNCVICRETKLCQTVTNTEVSWCITQCTTIDIACP